MAEHKVNGTDWLLFLSRDNVTFSTVVCLTSQSVNRTTQEIDAATKCGPDTLPGTQTNDISFEGQVLADPDSGKVSTDEIDDYWRNKDTVYFKVGKAVPITGDYVYTGSGFISELNETGAQNTPVTFTGKISIYGTIGKTNVTS